MRTDDLIRAMSADTTPVRPVAVMLPLALLAGMTVGALVFGATLGVQPDLWGAIVTTPVFLKHAFPILMAAAAFGAVARLARPEARLDGWTWALMLAPALAVISFWVSAAVTPVAAWPEAIMGQTTADCVLRISLLGLATLAGALWALRRGASAHPRLSGALAGLLSGSAAAALFALFCTENNPMFWGFWYVLAIGIVTAIGALLGRRLLRW
ncbi:MAG: DUF1109 domain-containing protein [Rhodobacteraceae bacterium]|nr:DUF1109 domain-containing protein [Paracoccaceae bacterium]